MTRVWTHDELARDLADHLRSAKRMVWCDMQLGPSGSPRPDVYTIEKSFSRPAPMAYEVKRSRADLRTDLASGKWQSYLKYAGGVVFAVPDGLATPVDLPAGVGLIVRKDAVWRYVRRATVAPVHLPMDAAMKLLIDGVDRTIQNSEPRIRFAQQWLVNEVVRQRYGEAVALAARDLVAARAEVSRLAGESAAQRERIEAEMRGYRSLAQERIRREELEAAPLRTALLAALGMEDAASLAGVPRRIEQLRTECNVDARVATADARLERARTTIQTALQGLAP